MSEKSSPGRFTVQFNAADPRQAEVIDILNQQGRRKASFLTDAIWQYVHGMDDGPRHQTPAAISTRQIEEIVKRVIKEQQKKAARQEIKRQNLPPRPSAQTDKPTDQPEFPDSIPPDMAAIIARDMASIRC